MSKSPEEIQAEVDRQTLKLKEPVCVMHLWDALGQMPHFYKVSVHGFASVDVRVDHENQTVSIVGM